MKKAVQFFCVSLTALGLACGGSHDHDHDHANGHDHDHDHDHDHAHGDGDHSHGDGGHAHQPKYGGTPIELGEHQYHAELLRDAEAGKMKAWLLDGHLENFIRVKTESFELKATVGGKTETLTFLAMPNSATGETVGDTSYFEAQADWLKETGEFAAEIVSLDIRGSKFEGVTFAYPKGNE